MSKKEFSPETWIDLSNKPVDVFQELEDEMLMYQYQILNMYLNLTFNEWYEKQIGFAKKIENGLIMIVKNRRKEIEEAISNAIDEASAIGIDKLKEATNQSITITNNEKLKNDLVEDNLKLLIANHKTSITALPSIIYSNLKMQDSTAWTMEQHLDSFHKAIDLAYKRELPKMTSVTYTNGREVSFKSYVEMAIRTEVNNVAVNMLEEGSKALGLVFFICSYLSDCAIDHADYQGKIYVLENWKSVIPSEEQDKYQKLIETRNIKTLEWVKNEGTYTTNTGKTYKIALGVRPNCRHTFTPITYEQALSRNKTLDNLGLKSKGTYSKEKYIQSQKQRNLERKIRQLKLDYYNKIELVKKTKNEREVMLLNSEASALYKQVRNAQKQLREHLNKYPYLVREYSRENPLLMRYDLGVTKWI